MGESGPMSSATSKAVETKAAQGFSGNCANFSEGKSGASAFSSGPTFREGVAPREALCHKGFEDLGPVGPVGPLVFEGEGRKTGSRVPGGGGVDCCSWRALNWSYKKI